MNQTFRIYTFGSDRHYQNFKKGINNPDCEVVQINEESEEFKVSKSAEELFNEFKNLYKGNIKTKGFIIFGRATVKNGIENIAEAVELIKKEYLELQQAQVIGPSFRSAKIFINKFLTQKALANNNIPTPKTYSFDFGNKQELIKITGNINFPVILKALNLSGGRGMRFVKDSSILQKNITELKQKGINNLLITEFIKGIEVTYTILRLGDTFLRFPVSYKRETDEQLTHPDAKVKLSGFYDGYDQHYHYVEKIMRKYDIYGFFTLQGILFKNLVSNQYEICFIEAATRITGSTPIMAAALKDFDLYKTIADWIIHKNIRFSYEKSFAIQYSSYRHKKISSIKKLSKLNWVIEAKYENLAEMPYASDKRDRIRVSFNVNPQKNLGERLKILSDILENYSYRKDVSDALCQFQKKELKTNDIKYLEGTWNENVSWEFYLSDFLPERKLCSAVFGLLKYKNNVILTKTHRGWEIPGGHIEDNETIEEALQRELLEETGHRICRFKLIGYRKIIAKKPCACNMRNISYPFPVSYIPHYVAVTDTAFACPTGDKEEVLETKMFSLKELRKLDTQVKSVIEICLKRLNEIN